LVQTNIRINHVAVVPQGRAGADISILDSHPTKEKSMNIISRILGLGLKSYAKDASPEELTAAIREVGKSAVDEESTAAPQLEELIEDTDVSDLVNKVGGIDDVIARMNGGQSAATGRGCFDVAPRKVPAAAAIDRALSYRPFDGVPYSEGKAAYDGFLATDANSPELPASHFYNGVPHHIGKAAWAAYLASRGR